MSTSRRAIRRSLRTNFNPGIGWRYERARLRLQQAAHLPGLLTDPRLDRPIFIIGAPRSGTMLLYTVLRSHHRLAHWRPSEAHEVWEADYHPALRGWESNVLSASDVDPAAAHRIRRSLFLVTGKKRRLIDKTPRNVVRVSFIDALFPDGQFVYLQRDGRDNVNSLINAWRSPRYRTYRLPNPHSIPGTNPWWWKFVLYPGWQDDCNGPLEVVCAQQWSVSNRSARAALDKIDARRWTMVRYEDFVSSPVEQVGRLMDFLDLPSDETVQGRARATPTTPVNAVTPPERGKWRRENRNEIESILPLIAPVQELLGYPSQDS